ncbi:MAG: hypothetical protein KGN84_21720 [Acidobacteriota bacterium]|nr:hypothetical protein [Acidobacteriota bacterium]
MQRSEASVITFPSEFGAHRAEVVEQLERILASPLFRNSKRYPSLLRYVVEQTLDGHASDLKERTLGIEVFGRSPDYDTNLDPVVRISAAEIRKRIAQYYQEPGHEPELRINLPLGSYVPEFRFHEPQSAPKVVPAPLPPVALEVPPPPPEPLVLPAAPAAVLPWKAMALALAAVVIAGSIGWMKPWVQMSSLDKFWGPVLARNATVLVCIGRVHDADGRPRGVAFSDATTMARVAALLQSRGQTWNPRVDDQASFLDLRQGPAVLVGAFNDSWNLRLANSMRFTFHKEGDLNWIEDPKNPSSRAWSAPRVLGTAPLTKDYALVTRVLDPNTDRVIVTAGGIWGFGTLAAGEFLTNPKYMDQFASQAPAGWEKKNLQVVLSTEVIGNASGPPHVLAYYAW